MMDGKALDTSERAGWLMAGNRDFWIGSALAAMVFLLTVGIVVDLRVERSQQRSIDRSMEAIERIRRVEITILNQQRAIRNFAMGIDRTSVSFHRLLPESSKILNEARPLLHTSELRAIVADVQVLERRKNDFWLEVERVTIRDGSAAALDLLETGVGNDLTEEILIDTHQIAQNERGHLLEAREQMKLTQNQLDALYGAFVLVLLGLLAFLVNLTSKVHRSHYLSDALDICTEQDAHQKLLIRELNHRLKNTMATVQSLARQTITGVAKRYHISPSTSAIIEENYKTFESRLFALGNAHNLLTQAEWKGADLRDLALSSLSGFVDVSRFSAHGPHVTLSPAAAVTMNLLIHELATNAVKYGALSNEDGYIVLNWGAKNGSLCVEWRECDGPPVTVPESRGFGSKLIEKAAMREIGGTAEMNFEEDGLVCKIDIPLSDKVHLQ